MGVSLCLMKMAMTVTVSRIPPQATHIGTMASNESHLMYCISKSKHPRLSSYGHRPGPQSAHLNSFSTYSHGSQRSQLQQQVSPCKSKQIKINEQQQHKKSHHHFIDRNIFIDPYYETQIDLTKLDILWILRNRNFKSPQHV